MLTDRAPFEYVYLSKRLLTDLVQHEEAAKPRSTWSFNAHVKGFGFHRESKSPNYANLRDLAMRSTDLVSDNTGSVEFPGYYIRDRLDMWHGAFRPHMGWRGTVACYRGERTMADGRKTFVALYGSASNVIGRRPNKLERSEFYPSDMQGLYSLLDVVREHDDPAISLDFALDDYGLTEGARADTAIHFATHGATRSLGEHDFLARVFIDVEDHTSRSGFTGRVIVGAPIWIATLGPEMFSNSPGA